jgi:DUF4097 and DUF4098 domain-containing protein YvlB
MTIRTNLVACLLAILFAPPGYADQEVDQTQSVEPLGTVRIHNARGELKIQGWDRPEVRVVGELDDIARHLLFEVDGNLTVVHVDMPRRNVNWGDGSDLKIYVPERGQLQIDGVSSDVEVDGVVGRIAIRTVSGDVDLKGIGIHTRVKTVSGDIDVDDGSGKLSVISTSGDLDIDVQADDVLVDTMNGDIELRLGRFNRLMATSVNGSMQLTGELNTAGKLTAKTVNADMEVKLVAPVNARVIAVSLVGGSIENDLTDEEPRRNQARRLVLDTRSGDGSADVRLHTVNGSIEIN